MAASIIRRATETQENEWRPSPEGLWRWQVGEPVCAPNGFYTADGDPKYGVKFPLTLTEPERARLTEEYGAPPEGVMQSWRASYMVGWSLGFIKHDGTYQTTKMVDFLAACLGAANTKKFREWIESGGGPRAAEDELTSIHEWLAWWQELEVYGTVTHEPDKKDPSRVWARWAGPLAVGSLPGMKDPEYQAHGRGKLRAMHASTTGEVYPADHPAAGAAVEAAFSTLGPARQAPTDDATNATEEEPLPVQRAAAKSTRPMPQSTAVKPAPRQYEDVFTDDDAVDLPF